MIPAADLAELDQARARADQELTANVGLFRDVAAETSEDEAMLQAVMALTGGKWTVRQLGGMLGVAIARLARQEAG